jgi:hypothetical protein
MNAKERRGIKDSHILQARVITRSGRMDIAGYTTQMKGAGKINNVWMRRIIGGINLKGSNTARQRKPNRCKK